MVLGPRRRARLELDLPRISVIIPFYQAEATLPRCLKALLAQDLPQDQWELLMVDNNARDRSAKIVAAHPEVRLLRDTKQGAYAARNRGIAEASGDLIAFTDPDCVPARDWLRRLLAPFDDAAVQIAIGRTELDASSRTLADLDDYELNREQILFQGDDPQTYFGRNNNMAVRRELFESLGYYDERQRGADTALVRRCVDRDSCAAVVFVPEARVLHLEVADLATYTRKAFVYGRSMVLMADDAYLSGISTSARWQAYRDTCRRGEFSAPRAARLFLVLVLSSLSWLGGRAAARFTRREPSETHPD